MKLNEIVKLYKCPKCKHELIVTPQDSIYCYNCNYEYSFTYGIIDFDIIKLEERTEFDEKRRTQDTLTELEINSSKALFSRFTDVLNIQELKNMNILDVACGTGELTVGIYLSDDVKSSNIFAFDHSIEGLRVLNSVKNKNTNNLLISCQDINHLAYDDSFFDYVFGSAVLHHFLDYSSFLNKCFDLLKPGGRAVFLEPMAYGYVYATFVINLAKKLVEEKYGTKIANENTGNFQFITTNISSRMNNYNNPTFLSNLTDKHLFSDEDLYKIGLKIGFKEISLFNLKENDYYHQNFLQWFLSTYHITNEYIVSKAIEIHYIYSKLFEKSLSKTLAHAKFLVFKK